MINGYEGVLSENAQLALDTILQKPVKGIPGWLYHTMQHDQIERIAGAEEGAYEREPERVYLDFQLKSGTCMIDQFIPLNPLKMGNRGFKEDAQRGATTGKKEKNCAASHPSREFTAMKYRPNALFHIRGSFSYTCAMLVCALVFLFAN